MTTCRGFLLVCLSAVVLAGCDPEGCNGELDLPKNKPCGGFDLSLLPVDDPPPPYPLPGRVKLIFNFDPTKCDAPDCPCRQVVFLQMLRFIVPPHEYRQPYDQQRDRMVQSDSTSDGGWAIDRSELTTPDADGHQEPAIWPYYGMENDGKFRSDSLYPDLFSATPGSRHSSAMLRDIPGSSEIGNTYEVQVVSVPVCRDEGSACNNKILGYYLWKWSADLRAGTVSSIVHGTQVVDVFVPAFDLAVAEWNNHTDNTRQPIPPLSRLP